VGTVVDSSVLIAAERGDLDLTAIVGVSPDDEVVISAITASELLHGVHRLRGAVQRARTERLVERVLTTLTIVPFDLTIARAHALLSADLRTRGIAVGAHDLIIAATAVALGFAVATRDRRSFPKIAGLRVLYW
jgi:predicted nucleic acid-binding protein